MKNQILNGDVIEKLRELSDESVNCVITSPPYFGLRDYGTAQWEGGDEDCDHKDAKKKTRYDYSLNSSPIQDKSRKGTDAVPQMYKKRCPTCGAKRIDAQIGLEETPEAYVEKLVEVFREVKRVLREDGTVWLNLGDTYWSGAGASRHHGYTDPKHKEGRRINFFEPQAQKHDVLKGKDLVGIPWRVAFALQADGWYLRQDIIWNKPNPMPESVRDRCTKSHEYVFLLTKSPKYYYDAEAIKEESKDPESHKGRNKRNGDEFENTGGKFATTRNFANIEQGKTYPKRNKRSVWTITTRPAPFAHFAVFPEALVEPCIKAGCPEQVCNKCGKARERKIERIAGQSKETPKTQAAHEARGGTGKPVGTVGKSGGARIDGYTKHTGWTDCGCGAGFKPGIVLDPFLGSGTVAVVAHKLGRDWLGVELSEEYIAIAEKRIKEATSQGKLLT